MTSVFDTYRFIISALLHSGFEIAKYFILYFIQSQLAELQVIFWDEGRVVASWNKVYGHRCAHASILLAGQDWSSHYLCMFWSLPSKVEYVLFLTKVLDNYLETVWPETYEKQLTTFKEDLRRSCNRSFITRFRLFLTNGQNSNKVSVISDLTCQIDCHAHHTQSTHSDQSAL